MQRHDLPRGGRTEAYWHALKAVHGSTGLADGIPALPCTVTVSTDADGDLQASAPRSIRLDPQAHTDAEPGTFSFGFSGAPCPMLPLLKQMVRFERPFITWDIWNSAPPPAFPASPLPDRQAADAADGAAAAAAGSEDPPLRDPDRANRVCHLGNRQGWAAARKRAAAADWVEGGAEDLDSGEDGQG